MIETIAFIPLIVASFTTPTALVSEVFENSVFYQRSQTDVILDVPYVNQKTALAATNDEWAGGSACGPASLNMVLNHQGKALDLQTIVNSLPTNVYVKGSMFYDLASGPVQFGFISNSIEISTKEIYQTLSKGYPIVLNIQNYDGITGHAVVVVGIKGFDGESADSLIVHDPFRAPYRVFEYINENTLKQPEGYFLSIGINKPFYVTKYSFAQSHIVE